MMLLRPRRSDDLERLAELLERVHRHDGYPRSRPGSFVAFLDRADLLGAWVAELDGQLVGHVAAAPEAAPGALELVQRSTERSADDLGAIVRLFSDPDHRAAGHRIGAQLLAHVQAELWRMGRRPFLDVTTASPGPIAFYRTHGFLEVGTTTHTFPSGVELELAVFLGPDLEGKPA